MRRRAEEVPALRPILDALRRGTKRSKLRLLVVVCPAGHTLLEVFPTSVGPVALWDSRNRDLLGRRPAGQRGPDYITQWTCDLLDPPYGMPIVGPHCRCTKYQQIARHWLHQQVQSGARRVVAPGVRL